MIEITAIYVKIYDKDFLLYEIRKRLPAEKTICEIVHQLSSHK